MFIEFELTQNDIEEFKKFRHKQSPNFQATILMLQMGVPVFLIIIAFILIIYGRPSAVYQLPLLVIVSIIWIILIPRLVVWLSNEGSERLFVGVNTIDLNPEGIIENNAAEKMITPWVKISKILLTDNFILLYIQEGLAYIIPKRIFSTEESYREFIETAQGYHEQCC